MINKSLTAKQRKKAAQTSLFRLAAPEYEDMCKLWDLCDDVFGGELKVKSRDDKYIYQPVNKSGKTPMAKRAWEAYKGRGVMPDYAASTLEKMCGILSSAQPEIKFDNKASRLDFMRENATPYHDGLDALADRVRRQILRTGRYCLLLEPDEEGDLFHINEYKARKYLRARTVDGNGESYADLILLDTSCIKYDAHLWRDVYYPQITLLALDGQGRYYQAKFGEKGATIESYVNDLPQYASSEQYLNAMDGVFAMLESFDIENPDENKCSRLIYPVKYGKTLDRIPFVCINPGDMNFGDYWNPPLLKLCLQSIHILNSDCTYKTSLFMTGDPQPYFSGMTKKDLQGGSDCPWFLPPGATFAYASPSGAGLSEQANSLDKMKEEAQHMGVSLSGQENMTNTPVGTMQLYRNSQTADLMRINENTGKAIELILRYAGEWLGMSAEEIGRDIAFMPSKEFAEIKATPQEAVTLIQSDVPMTEEEKRQYLEKNNIVDARPWEEVKAELDEEKEANQANALNSVAGAFGFAPKQGEESNEEPEKKPDTAAPAPAEKAE